MEFYYVLGNINHVRKLVEINITVKEKVYLWLVEVSDTVKNNV